MKEFTVLMNKKTVEIAKILGRIMQEDSEDEITE